MTVIEGVDYAFSVPSASALAAAGKQFAVRYGGPGSTSKQLTVPELASLRARGIDVVANAEGSSGGFTGTTAGVAWARSAQAHFSALGMPDGRPIYFSVDWNAGLADWPGIDAACRGAASVIGPDRVGVYGGYRTIAHCHDAGTARWFWQTYAWSVIGGNLRWHPANHLEQYRNGVTIGGADCDLDRAVQPDYGQWGVSDMTTVDLTPASVAAIAAAVKTALTTPTAFTDADGGNHNPISDAILNAQQVPGADGKRDLVWQVFSELHTAPVVSLTQEQLNAAFLAALKTLAGGQA